MFGTSAFATIEYGGVVGSLVIVTFASGKKAYLFIKPNRAALLTE